MLRLSKDFIELMDEIMKMCKKYNIPCGDHIIYPDTKKLENKIKDGYRFLAYSLDAVFLYNQSENPYKND